MKKIRVCIFAPFYAPGFRGGGPVKSIINLVDKLSDNFEFWIVTSDRDLGDTSPYHGIRCNEWITAKNANLYYASKDKLSFRNLATIVNKSCCHVIYLNSFFNPSFSIKPLIFWKLGLFRGIPVLIAPRGEFSPGALQIKSFKKRCYIAFVRLFGIYKSVFWQATTRIEKTHIIQALGVKESMISRAKNLPGKFEKCSIAEESLLPSENPLKLVFLSRISPKKNLEFALNVLQKVGVPVCFDIYGPKEDASYWLRCDQLIKKLPENITVQYCGEVNPSGVGKVFSKYDIFFFPTRGENYGHVIAEALSVGTPVLLSDQTPWQGLKDDSLGWNFPLAEENSFINAIRDRYGLSTVERNSRRMIVCENAYKRIFNPEDLEANKNLFLKVLTG
jgi:glycosyltransferase involved in cell wall biosynthesis